MKKILLTIALLCTGAHLSAGLTSKKGIQSQLPSDMQTRAKGKTKPAMEPVKKGKKSSQNTAHQYDE